MASRETAARPDERGYGDGWERLRRRTLRRDSHACTRCGADDRTLQAHHVVPRSAGGPDELENLLTLCRPCHGVIHQYNRSFDDVREDAPLFPDPDSPTPVARMRTPDDQICSRCGTEHDDATELVAWTDVPDAEGRSNADHLILCKPCAGLVLEHHPGCTWEELDGNHRFQRHELSQRRLEASVRPSAFGRSEVGFRREPRNWRERVIDDTPLRFLFNSKIVRGVGLVVVAYLTILVLAGAL
ncbi:HNH endonuclease [Natrarchaeobius sp. A-rgal3]|uniref:HNH endonuclease n=1 Tax=Natrarchaeobius versutus TaxID=1679078 RepID=UPI00350EC629